MLFIACHTRRSRPQARLSRAAAEPEQSAEARAAFAEHAHGLLPLLLLHACHDDPSLCRASLAALRALEPWYELNHPEFPPMRTVVKTEKKKWAVA